MTSADRLQALLHEHGFSLTTPRQAVYQALQGEEPLTMHELVAKCVAVDRASVYRCVALYEQLGIVQRLQTGWKYKLELTGAFHPHHHHITCLSCGQTVTLAEDAPIEQRLQKLASEAGFQTERHQIELQGYCAACQALLDD